MHSFTWSQTKEAEKNFTASTVISYQGTHQPTMMGIICGKQATNESVTIGLGNETGKFQNIKQIDE